VNEIPSPRLLAAFRGAVSCQRHPGALILTGLAAGSEEERLVLTIIGAGLPDGLASLEDPEVLALGEHHYRISTRAQSWEIEPRSVHLHRDIGKAFYRAIPPRRVPLRKRLFWRLALALAGTRTGRRVLSAFRRG
jgi:hypothetical protein